MNIRHIRLIFNKELTSALRDRRTLFAMILLPVLLVPLLTLMGPAMVERQVKQLDAQLPSVALAGPGDSSLVKFLAASGKVDLVPSDKPEEVLMAEKVQAVLYVPGDLDRRLAAGEKGIVRIGFDASNQKSSIIQERLKDLVNQYAQNVVAQRLQARGVDLTLITPFDLKVENVAPQEKVGGSFLGLIIPLLLAMWAALGGMYAAIDAAASEKERGTLEPLLAAPVSRLSLVMGKYLTVVLTSVLSAGLSMLGMYVVILFKPEVVMGSGAGDSLRFSLPFANILLMILIAAAVSCIFSALQLCVSAYARSYREANTYLSPLSLVVVLPGVATQFLTPSQMPGYIFAVPLLNAITVAKEVLMGTVDWNHIGLTLMWSAVYIILALRLTVRVFNRESVLFRT